MPQLDIHTYTSQLFWLFLSFTSLYFFTWRVTLPRMMKIMDARRLRIEGSIHKADELKRQADDVRAEFETVLSATRTQAQENILQMIQKVGVTTAARKKDLSELMASRIQSSEDRIDRQRIQALAEIKGVAEVTALQVVEKLIDQKIDPKTVANIMDELFSKKVA